MICHMTAAYRARKGEAKNTRNLFSAVAPEVYEAYETAAAERGITKRALLERALMREIADPTILAPDRNQQELPLNKTA